MTAVLVDDCSSTSKPATPGRRHAIAFDLGTTTVRRDADEPRERARRKGPCSSILNKQQPFGADVISRTLATMMDPQALGMLQRVTRTRRCSN